MVVLRSIGPGPFFLLLAVVALLPAEAQTRPLPQVLDTGFYLSPLRPHPSTGEDFRPTSTREFLDLMKHSTPFDEGIEQGIPGQPSSFVHYNIPEHISVPFRRDGYPARLDSFEQWGVLKQMSTKATIGWGGAFVEDGEYVATWSGIGNLSFEGDAELLNMSSQTARVFVRPSSGVVVRIVGTSSSDPLHALTLVPAAFEHNATTQVFHPQFLKALEGARTLRFAGWQMVDAWDQQGSLAQQWANRSLPTDQTQAGAFGVCVEHMVELANRIGADAWFSMPKAFQAGPGVIDPYASAFADVVKANLRTDLKVYVEYRSCCLNGLAPGWDSQENAVQSLTAWSSWEASLNASRVINTISSLAQIDKFGSDIGRVEAAAIEASFGQLCSYGESPCVAYDSIEAYGTYGNLTAEELVEEVLRPAMLKKESEVNTVVQQALHYGLHVLAFDVLPLVSARNYGHRGTLNWALRCEHCLMEKEGRRYGRQERAALAAGGYVHEREFRAFFAYEGLSSEDRISGTYWLQGTPEDAKAQCRNVSECAGFTYVKSGEWSCGTPHQHRYGDCSNPGTAYLFKRSRLGSGARTPPTSCQAYSVPGTEDCTIGRVDTYWKVNASMPPNVTEESAEEAAMQACSECQYGFNSHWYTWEVPLQGYNLDRLHEDLPELIARAAQEQSLEQKMIEALRLDSVETLLLDYLERLRHLGFSTVVGGLMHRQLRQCRTGGKACGVGSLRTHPDDNGPVNRALNSFSQGVRAPPAPAPAPSASCSQACVYGVCEGGSCRCWQRARGADCSELDTTPRCERPLGLSLSGVSYWTREWIFVDVFKHVGSWIAQEFTSYSWNAGSPLQLREEDGYPAALLINQAARVLTVRDVERHYVDGWYTVFYDGEGILEFDMDVTAVRRVAPGHVRVHVVLQTTGNNGIGIRVSHTREDNPVRNIRVVTPGFEDVYATSPFHPAFVASLQGFSVLRFMDWMHANSEHTPWSWERRATPDYYTQGATKGVSVEYMVRLANEVGADPWFSLPINATDDYIRNFSAYVSGHLRPDVGVYMELGNEAWHTGFYGGQWAQQQGAAMGLSFLCWYALRTSEMAAVAREAMPPPRRLTVVAGSQAVNSDATSQLLQCQGINASDAIGLGPYFDGYGILPNPDANLTAVLDSYATEVHTALRLVREHKALLNGTKFKLVAYEAGPGGTGDGSGTDLAIQAHRHPRMQGIVKSYLEALDEELDLVVYFASCGRPSQYGSWGLIEAMDQPRHKAVKYLAVKDFLNSTNSCKADDRCGPLDNCNGMGLCGADSKCYCYRGYSGNTCLNASYTDYVACGYRCTFDQGMCGVSGVVGNLRSWACECHTEYSGATCSRFECQDGCNQRGHCIASGVCSCFRGFRGGACEIDCGCGHHGQCDGSNRCICDRGWRLAVGGGCEWDCDTVDTLGCSGPGRSACAGCRWGDCLDGACQCWAGYHGPSCDVLNKTLQANSNSTFGINVALTHATFVDVMKTSRHWTSVWDRDTFAGQFFYQGNSLLFHNRQYEWGNGQAINQSSDGYIRSLARDQAVITLALRDVCLHAPAGRYVVTYDGDGELDFSMDARPAAFQKGRIDIDFSPTCRRECWFDKKTWRAYCSDNGIAITLRRVNPANPLRNVRIIMPGFLATHEVQPFHPWFLKNLERFSSIRFMDWGKTNSDAFVKRRLVVASFVRFTVLGTKGGGAPRVSELLLRGADGAELLQCTSQQAPELCDGDPSTDWAPVAAQGGSGSAGERVVVALPAGAGLTSYMWMTSGWSTRVDPITWLLEVSTDGANWTLIDRRATRQQVTYYRRRHAAEGAPEEKSWYTTRLPGDLFQWADRTLPTDRSQAVGPVALEYQVLLANTLGSAPWVCVHHLASDDYVRKEAEFWLNNTRPDVQVYVEHSNEVWNPLFPQGRYATEMGTILGLANGTCRTNLEHCARVRYNAYRSKRIFAIWEQVWGLARSRLRFVLSTQASWADVTHDLLSLPSGHGADVLGVTAYFHPEPNVDASYSPKTPTEVTSLFRAGIEPARSSARAQKALADQHGLDIAVYEGGVGLVEDGVIEGGLPTGPVTELLMATGRSSAFKPAVEDWLDMYRTELGDNASFNYFVDTGFWSKYGQWGMLEYYDAQISASPAAAAVHAHLDARYGSRPSCVVADSLGRGLPPDSFLGPPAVTEPRSGALLVVGRRYRLRWAGERLPAGRLDFYLWQRTSCSGSGVPLGWAEGRAGSAVWQVPSGAEGQEYFIELRARAPSAAPSNYSAMFTVVSEANAPLDYLLYVENDVDLLSAFYRDCKKGSSWALRPHFRIDSCAYSSAEGCRTYRTARKRAELDGPPPWQHGSWRPLTDCTLHIIGLRQTMRLEGLTRGFDLSAEDTLARLVANASQLPPGAVSVRTVGAGGSRRLSGSSVDLEISVASDDETLPSVALGLGKLSQNAVFTSAVSSGLNEGGLQVVAGNVSAEDGSSDAQGTLSFLSAPSSPTSTTTITDGATTTNATTSPAGNAPGSSSTAAAGDGAAGTTTLGAGGPMPGTTTFSPASNGGRCVRIPLSKAREIRAISC